METTDSSAETAPKVGFWSRIFGGGRKKDE